MIKSNGMNGRHIQLKLKLRHPDTVDLIAEAEMSAHNYSVTQVKSANMIGSLVHHCNKNLDKQRALRNDV